MPDPIRRTDALPNVEDLNALAAFPSDGADSGVMAAPVLTPTTPPPATQVTGFYRSETSATAAASAAEGEVAARTVPLTEAGKARPGENLSPIEAHREVYVNAAGHFVTRPGQTGAPPTVADLGEGLYRAASIVDDTKANLFRSMPADVRTRMIGNVAAAAARAPAGGAPPAGLDATQAKQLRSSAATVLLELMDSLDGTGSQASAKQQAYQQFVALLRAETDKVLRQSMATNLDLKSGGLSPAQKAEVKALLEESVPTKPPYDKWFAGGNDTVRVAWSIGSEFLEGNQKLLEARGFRKTSETPLVYSKEIEKDGKKTKFEIALRYNRGDMFVEMGDPKTHMVVYDGHSDWGRNVRTAIGRAPDMQGAKVALIGMCAGKGELNMIEDKYPDGQTITTWNSSYFWTDPSTGHQTRSENFEALMASIDGIAGRKDWPAIAEDTRKRAMIARSHTVDNNYIFPTDKEIRRRVLDRDFDGQADHFDRFVDFSTFHVAEDSANDYAPKDPGRPADKLAGTRVHIAAMGINRNSYYNEVLHDANPRGSVVDDGFYQPKPGDREIVRFQKDTQNGTPVVRMRVNADFSHMSEESIRALAQYEYNRHLAREQGGRWPYGDVDNKIHGLILISHSLDTDTGYRDREVWDATLKALGFPPIDKALVDRIREADHHWYAGAKTGVAELKRSLPGDVLARLADASVGRPNAAGVR